MNNVSTRLQISQLHLNVSTTVCMYFSERVSTKSDLIIMVQGQRLQLFPKCKYLGVILVSQLDFKHHDKKTLNTIKWNLSNFRYIRNDLTLESSKLYFLAIIIFILLHIQLGIRQHNKNTPQTSSTSISQKAQSPSSLSYTENKDNMLDWDSYVKYHDSYLIYAILHGPAHHLYKHLSQNTTAVSRVDCTVPLRKSAVSQAVFSYRASHTWILIPTTIRQLTTLSWDLAKQIKS